ncbi:hypothetical protein Dimus_002408 [Dionaea muscipula]
MVARPGQACGDDADAVRFPGQVCEILLSNSDIHHCSCRRQHHHHYRFSLFTSIAINPQSQPTCRLRHSNPKLQLHFATAIRCPFHSYYAIARAQYLRVDWKR